jgi:hypothetical protein
MLTPPGSTLEGASSLVISIAKVDNKHAKKSEIKSLCCILTNNKQLLQICDKLLLNFPESSPTSWSSTSKNFTTMEQKPGFIQLGQQPFSISQLIEVDLSRKLTLQTGKCRR